MLILRSTLAVIVLATTCFAAEPPDAPSSSLATRNAITPAMFTAVTPVAFRPATEPVKIVDKKFLSLAIISAGSTLADSYTTLFATQNWLAGKKGVCNIEVQSPYLYGTHPTAGRAYAVASAKAAGSIAAAYWLRKHHSKFWSAPLVANSVMSLQGVSQNLANCN